MLVSRVRAAIITYDNAAPDLAMFHWSGGSQGLITLRKKLFTMKLYI